MNPLPCPPHCTPSISLDAEVRDNKARSLSCSSHSGPSGLSTSPTSPVLPVLPASSKKAGFTFKQFHVNHDRCAMKVGTDGILLGAWADVTGAERILDIGSGSGLIALMLAQRSAAAAQIAQITGVDIEEAACLQAKENAAASPWASQLQFVRQDFQRFAENIESEEASMPFDLIVSNPPYFVGGQTFQDPARQKARHTGTLTHLALLSGAASILSVKGKIQLVLPYEAGMSLVEQSKSLNLSCFSVCKVKTTPKKAYHRVLIGFSREKCDTIESELVIHSECGGYSDRFTNLTQAFYLKM